jgi:hypothetical protein
MLLATALLVGACGSTPSTSKATVSGKLTWYRCFGAVSSQRPCPEVPVENAQISFVPTYGPVVHSVTDSSGRYVVQLDSGDYVVSLGFPMLKGPERLQVRPGESLQASFLLRFPAY